MIAEFVAGLRRYWDQGGKGIAVAAVGGVVLMLLVAYAGTAGLLALCWNAFLTLFGLPALSFGAACGALGLVCFVVVIVVLLKDAGEA